MEEDHSVFAADSGDFKEVRSKKNMKQQQGQKILDERSSAPGRGGGSNKERSKSTSMKNSQSSNQSPGSTNIPSGVGGMQSNQSSSKNYNSRTKKLPPRFEKQQKEKQKASQQQQQQAQQQQQFDVTELNKLNQQNVTLYPIKGIIFLQFF